MEVWGHNRHHRHCGVCGESRALWDVCGHGGQPGVGGEGVGLGLEGGGGSYEWTHRRQTYGRTYGRTHSPADRPTDPWTDPQTDLQTHRRTHGPLDGPTDRQTHGQSDSPLKGAASSDGPTAADSQPRGGRTDGRSRLQRGVGTPTDGQTDRWSHEGVRDPQTDRWTDGGGRTDRWMDGWTDGQLWGRQTDRRTAIGMDGGQTDVHGVEWRGRQTDGWTSTGMDGQTYRHP